MGGFEANYFAHFHTEEELRLQWEVINGVHTSPFHRGRRSVVCNNSQ